MTASAFYDRLAPHYHLIFEDWTASIERQGAALDSIIRSASGGSARSVVDVACGIGTQTLGLAARGYEVTASDVSRAAIERARIESVLSKLAMDFSVADMRDAYRHHQRTFDVVLCADNSLPHLLTDSDILKALQQFLACTRPGGLCLVSVRDYDAVQRDGVHFQPYGVRTEAGARYVLFQVWSWRAPLYELDLYIVRHPPGQVPEAQVMRCTYYAVTTARLAELMRCAGFADVRRLDDVFYQPVLVGVRPEKMRAG